MWRSHPLQVNCLDPGALFSRPDILSVTRSGTGQRRRRFGQDGKYLIFSAGGATFAVDTQFIWATVQRRTLNIKGVRVEGGTSLGFIEHIGWKVPVIDTNLVIGLGQSARPTATEVVVLRFPNGKLLGLHVEDTERLAPLHIDALQDTNTLAESRSICGRACHYNAKKGSNGF